MENQVKNVTSGAPAVRRKIPVSLSVVSYIFFTIGLLAILRGLGYAINGRASLLVSLIVGVFYLFISGGLRRCARLWHVCALIVIACSLVSMVYGLVNYLRFPTYYDTSTFAYRYLLLLAFMFSVNVWMLQVLTRADVRRLFYGGRNNAV